MGRFQARRRNGRFTRNTLENTFGITAEVCPRCRQIIPRGLDEPKPQSCPTCGADLGETVPKVPEATGPDQTPIRSPESPDALANPRKSG